MAKKIICLILAFVMVASLCVPVFAAEYPYGRQNIFIKYNHINPNSYDEGWTKSGFTFPTSGTMVPFRPLHDYVSEQNPPDFMWPLNANAESYDLIVCSDPELKTVVYEKKKIPTNFYNFEHTFETGVNYWWAVRYNFGNVTSGWSDARRFRIAPDAHEFTSPDLETLMARIPKGHPRVYTNPDELEAYRAMGDGDNRAVSNIKRSYIASAENRLKTDIDEMVPDDFPLPTEEEKKNVRWGQNLRSKVATGYGGVPTLGYAYLLTGDERFGRRCVEEMVKISGWDPTGATSYKMQDQIHREIMLNLSMSIDWCWDAATPAEREIIIAHILRRMDDMEYLLDSIPKNPYDSHGWSAYGFICIAGIALYGETPRAEKWLRAIIPTYTAFLPPWGNQDGGWSQGTGYWQYSSQMARDPMDVLADAGVIDLYQKAWQQNEYLWMMYATPKGSYGSFGDETNISQTFGGYVPELAGGIAYRSKDEHVAKVARWLANQYGPSTIPQMYRVNTRRDEETLAPYDYPLAHEFNDIGWVLMTDDLISEDRIQMTFKSSHWGSFNHSQADQNSFTIQAYGKKLASRGGYYDAYHTKHDSGITRKTAAHNSVTLATNRGQRDDSINAKGELTGYLNHMDFDLVTGDATPAYLTNIDYFERHMIYIRPDIFVVIDDLDSYKGKKEKYEWWLNTDTDIEVYEGGVNGCRTQNGNAVLDTQVHYPQKVTTYYNNIHALSDMIEIPAASPYDKANVQRRVWFETEALDATKMVVTMDVHKADVGARAIDTQYGEDHVKLTFEDGTVLIVNLNTDEREEITVGNISFRGAAVVYNDESIMLVSGTSLKEGGVELIASEKLCSVVMGKDEISLSTYEDNVISLHNDNDYVKGIAQVKNENDFEMGPEWGLTITEGKKVVATYEEPKAEEKKEDTKKSTSKKTDAKEEEVAPAEPKVTYAMEDAENYTTFECAKDNYTLVTNGKSIKSDTNVSAKVKVVIDGVELPESEVPGYTKRDGTANYMGEIVIPSAKYIYEGGTSGINFGGYTVGASAIMGTVAVTTPNAENVVYLKTVESHIVNVKETNAEGVDADTLKPKLTIFKEAEDAIKLAPASNTYTTRAWLSGGVGVQLHNQLGQTATYAINVQEAGYYDIAVKYVAWDFDNTARAFAINGVSYVIPLPRTIDYGTVPESWKYVVGDCNIYLEPGEYVLSIEAMEGSWNYDYLGLVKR